MTYLKITQADPKVGAFHITLADGLEMLVVCITELGQSSESRVCPS